MAKRRIQKAFPILLALLSAAVSSTARGGNGKEKDFSHFTPGATFCRNLLNMYERDELNKTQVGNWTMVTSGRDRDNAPKLAEAIQKIFGEGGVAQRLGYALPPHQLTMAPSDKLAILATLGRHAIPHWLDGMRIVREAAGARGVMEFVTPGCPTCRSFYRDTTGFIEQISILFHVAGHNDFSVYSPFAFRRQADPIKASLELADMVREYSQKYDRDAVHLFYQYLNSFSFLQDLSFGEFTHPDDFKMGGTRDADLKKVEHFKGKDGQSPYYQEGQSNISTMQSLVAYLKAHGPEWKYNLAAKYEEMVRVYGYVPVTKIMNEGWATFSMILMVAHSEYSTSHHILDYANLLSGVAYPRLTNPYWLGLEAWLRVYKRFLRDHPELKSVPLIEQDRKFVEHAHKMIGYMNDHEFLREALDEQWVYTHQLALFRKAEFDEQDPNMPWDPAHPENNEQKIVVSDDPRRVIDYVADLAANKRKQIPRVAMLNPYSLDRNVYHLKHEVYDDIPLELKSAAQTLHVLSQTLGVPAALDTIHSEVVHVLDESQNNQWWWGPRFIEKIVTTPIRMEVDLGGKVTVYDLLPGGEQVNAPLTAELQRSVDNYKESLVGLINGDLEFDWKHLHMDRGKQLMKVADQNSSHVMGGILHDPNSASAVREFLNKMKSILPARLRAQLQSGNVRRTRTGMAVPIFPEVPDFQFDREFMEIKERLTPPTPVDRVQKRAVPTATFTIDLGHFNNSKESIESLVYQFASFQRPGHRVVVDVIGFEKAPLGVLEIVHALTTNHRTRVDGRLIDLSDVLVTSVSANGDRKVLQAPLKPNYKLELGTSSVDSALTQQQGDFTGVKPGRWRRRGDRFWGPSDQGGPGRPGPGEPGEEHLEPQEVEITLEDYGKYLSEELQLPNIRRTSGESHRVRMVPEGSILKPEGEIDWSKTIARPNAYGASLLSKELRDLQVEREAAVKAGDTKRVEELDQKILIVRRKMTSILQRIQKGLSVTTESDYYTEVQTPEKVPDFKAVVFFMIDMSGSMSGSPQETAKNISYKIRAILRHFYKDVEVVFVGFDTEGREFSEEEVFGSFLGGGTMYASGYKKVEELYPRYPRSKYNRYLITLGDGETWEQDAQESIQVLERLHNETQYIGFGYLNMNSWGGGSQFSGPFTQALQNWGASKEWFGFANIPDPSEQSQMDAIKKFFGKKN